MMRATRMESHAAIARIRRHPMNLQGEQLIRAPRVQVWAALNDPQTLMRCIPGCEEILRTGETEMQARLLAKIGPVRARFGGRILMSEIVVNEGCRMAFEGNLFRFSFGLMVCDDLGLGKSDNRPPGGELDGECLCKPADDAAVREWLSEPSSTTDESPAGVSA